MGGCYSTHNKIENIETNDKINIVDKIQEEKHINDYPDILDLENIEKAVEQMKNNICRIHLLNGLKGTGFFCKIPFPDINKLLPVLITNNHIIDEDIINNGKIINISINGMNKDIEIKNRIAYTNKDYDVSIIEIKVEDNINDFLELDDSILNNNSNTPFVKSSIYLIQFPGNKEKPGVSFGVINSIDEINNYFFNHSSSTEEGSSGSPILNTNNKVIGIHKGSMKRKNNNIGIFINFPIKDFIEQKI